MPAILPVVYAKSGATESLPQYTSLGSYIILYYLKSHTLLCASCASKHEDEDDPVADCGMYQEGPSLDCEECGKTLASDYGDPEEAS